MYAVIFKAEIDHLDEEYTRTAGVLREKAMTEYGCMGFDSATEDNTEIAISYWPTLEQIAAWRDDPEHRLAKAKGQNKWYRKFSVQIVETIEEYGNEP